MPNTPLFLWQTVYDVLLANLSLVTPPLGLIPPFEVTVTSEDECFHARKSCP